LTTSDNFKSKVSFQDKIQFHTRPIFSNSITDSAGAVQ